MYVLLPMVEQPSCMIDSTQVRCSKSTIVDHAWDLNVFDLLLTPTSCRSIYKPTSAQPPGSVIDDRIMMVCVAWRACLCEEQ
ncbi:hypothetical protein EJ03DRAFT_195890 [Teratosphaeria nubilosa]|uniref:Uncharacterized protein n=1 Tax=Teratosphaeria nubilosa TaxID=161662 RepID=A0A6G1KZW2_9PEZI|nr:hypothetical protein EJ03DRAFT_195890 [Teratosphaeria nubilosa]